MRFRLFSAILTGSLLILLLGLASLGRLGRGQAASWQAQPKVVQARRPTNQITLPRNQQVRVGTPVEGPTITPRYNYSNEFLINSPKWPMHPASKGRTSSKTAIWKTSLRITSGSSAVVLAI